MPARNVFGTGPRKLNSMPSPGVITNKGEERASVILRFPDRGFKVPVEAAWKGEHPRKLPSAQGSAIFGNCIVSESAEM
jgi:hypothetical protein